MRVLNVMLTSRPTYRIVSALILLLVVPTLHAMAQAPDMRFKRLTVEDGLSNNNVLALVQDQRGYIWIGTNDGLNKYDGYGFTTYRHDARDSTTLSNNAVHAVLLDEKGRLWAGTAGGLNLYHSSTGTFTEYPIGGRVMNDPGSGRITTLFEDRSSRFWVGTTRGLYAFDPERSVFTRYEYESTSSSDFRGEHYQPNYVTSVYEDDEDRIWIGTAAGLNRLDPARGTFRRFELAGGGRIADEVRDMKEDPDGKLWVATVRDGLYHVDVGERTYTHHVHDSEKPGSLPSNSVRAVHKRERGLVVGTSEGVALYDAERDYFHTFTTISGDVSSLSFPSVRCILEDNRGNLWIGTWEGLNYFDHHSNHFVHVGRYPEAVRSLSDDLISSFAEDPDGGVWVGTERGGLNYLDAPMQRVRVFRHDPNDPASLRVNNVKALFVDRQGALWVGTHDGGLSRLDRDRGGFHHYRHDPSDSTSLSGNRVYAIHEDRFGDLWIGTNKNGLNRLDRRSGRFTRYGVDDGAGSISSNEINVIFEDRVGNLWIGTAHGLSLFDRRTDRFIHFLSTRADPGSLIDPTVRTLWEDSEGRLWVGTSSGLELFDRRQGTFTHFTVRDGLPNDAINCVLEDGSKDLWISTNLGLSRFRPSDSSFRNFDGADGLQSRQFNMNACVATRDGRLFFGGVNGFSYFHPENITSNPYAPPVFITGLKLFNQTVHPAESGSPLTRDIGETERIVLRHDQNVVSLDFVALNYTAQSRNEYAYVLEGFEEDWNPVGTQRTATYTNLPPGQYTFRVKAANNDGVWNEHGTSLEIRILPPLWRTWWAYLLYALFAATAAYGAYRYSVKVWRLKNSLALEQLRRRTEDDLHAAKMQFFTNVSHEFRTPLTLILGPIQELLADRSQGSRDRESLNLVRRNAERLLRLVNQLMDFRALETGHMRLRAQRTNVVEFVRELALSFDEFARHARIRFAIRSDYEGIYVWFDRDKLETVLVNLLSNAFKFTSDGGDVAIEVGVSGPGPQSSSGSSEVGMVHIAVRDTGIGMTEAELEHLFERFYQARPRFGSRHGTGIGLAFSKGIVELHGGKLTVESREGEGSVFTVILPLGSDHLEPSDVSPDDESRKLPYRRVELEEMELEENAAEHEGPDCDDAPAVLIVEDNRDMRAFIRNGVADHYRIYEAADGVEGFRVAVDVFPDLIVCDVAMPEMDGMTLCHKLKEDLRTSHIPIILLTARTSEADQVMGLDMGADAYVMKPFEMRVLLARIRNLIAVRAKLRERFSLDIPIKPVESGRSTRDDAFLRNVIDIIEERIADPDLTVESLSQDVGMSRVYLHKKLTALTNHTPSDLIRTIRLKHASRLLLEGDKTVSEVAYDVGYNTPSHFTTSFKKQFGHSPTDYVASFTARREEEKQ